MKGSIDLSRGVVTHRLRNTSLDPFWVLTRMWSVVFSTIDYLHVLVGKLRPENENHCHVKSLLDINPSPPLFPTFCDALSHQQVPVLLKA